MAAFKCKIATSDGEIIERIIVADSIRAVKKQITGQGNFLIKAVNSAAAGSFFSIQGIRKIKTKDFYSFNQEFSVLLKAGISVVTAFDSIITNSNNNSFVKILKEIRDDISAGESVSGAFGKYETLFSPLYIASISAGETGGDIPGAISRYLEHMKRAEEMKQKIKAASVYPVILTVCSLFVVSFLIIFVVPAITGTFVESGTELPFLTTILLSVSDLVKSSYLLILSFIIAIAVGFHFFLKSEKGRLLFDAFYLKLPLLGELSLFYSTARFSSSLATVLKSGTSLNSAVKISVGLVQNTHLQAGIKKAVNLLEQGEGFADSLKKSTILPGMAVRIIAAGEESGSLETVLKDIAEFYEKDVEAKLTIITSSIEPMLMVLMGLVIGFIVLAMYMPIFQMAGTMG